MRESASKHVFAEVFKMAKSESDHPIVTRRILLGTALVTLAASSVANAVPGPAQKIFKVGSRRLEGRPKTICVIEGKWADGVLFRYEAWDACNMMSVRVVKEKDYKDAPSLGSEDNFSVADIPRGSEVLEFTNDVSTTLVFRDRNGDQHEILTRD